MQVQTTTADANCGNDGQINVTLSGTDAASMAFVTYTATNSLTGISTPPIATPTIANLRAGSYSVKVSGSIGTDLVERTVNATVGGDPNYASVDALILSSRATLPGLQTGQIRLYIINGTLPYTVDLYRNGSATVYKTVTFTQAESEYLIDGLDEGNYRLDISSVCDHANRSTTIATLTDPYNCGAIGLVDTAAKPSFDLKNGMGEYLNDHIAGANLWQYRYKFDNGAFTPWANIPTDGIVKDNTLTNSCDAWDKNYVFEVRLKDNISASCQSGLINVGKPRIDTSQYVTFDDNGCRKDSFLYLNIIGNLYTLPVHLTAKDITTGATLCDTTFGHKDAGKSIPISSRMTGHTISINATDKNGCVMTLQMPLRMRTFTFWASSQNNSSCAPKTNGVWFGYSHKMSSAYIPPVGSVVELQSSPDPSLRFKAVYNRSLQQWTVTPSGRSNIMTNQNTVTLVDPSTAMNEEALPSGEYIWRVTDNCGTDTTLTVNYNYYRYEVKQHLEIDSMSRSCNSVYYFPTDQIVRYRRVFSGGAVIDEAAEKVTTFFNVYSTDGGLAFQDISSNVNEGAIVINPQYNINQNHFVVTSSIAADNCPLDTVGFQYLRPPAITLKDAGAYICSGASQARIIAVVDSTTGIEPYTFTLSDKNGTLLGQNNVGDFSVPSNIDEVMLKVTDDCNPTDAAYTYTEIPLLVLPIGGIDNPLIAGHDMGCFGSIDSIYGRLLLGDYEWTLPDGRRSNERKLYLSLLDPLHLDTGFYDLTISGLECPATDRFHVGLAYPYHETLTLRLCDVDLPYTLGDTIFDIGSTNGTYVMRRLTSHGCDSIVTVQLSVGASYNLSEDITICDNMLPYTYGDTLFKKGTVSGVYTLRRLTALGCDSITTLRLTVNPTYRHPDARIICSDDLPFTYAGVTFPKGTASDIYVVTLKTALGCDSIIDLHLTVNPSYHFYDSIVIRPENLPYPYHNILFDFNAVSGNYNSAFLTKRGCDSIFHLHLFINDTVDFVVGRATACADEQTVYIDYTLTQGTPTQYSLYFEPEQSCFTDIIDQKLDSAGATSIGLPIPVGCRPNEYRAWLTLSNFRYDSPRMPLTIALKYPSSVMLQKWNDVIALYNENVNGGYVYSSYQWRVNDTDIAGATGPYLYLRPTLDFTAWYSVTLTRADDGVTMETCPLAPVPKSDISLYPSALEQNAPFKVVTAERCVVTITTNTGRIVGRQQIEAGVNEILSPSAAGLYIVEVTGAKDKRTFKIVVQ